MLEAIRKKHNFWPGIGCFVASFILYVIAESSIPDTIKQSMASSYYLEQYLAAYPGVKTLIEVSNVLSSLLFVVGIILIFIYKKKIPGWKCQHCNSFIRKVDV